jgi:hypothetical protein
VFRASYGKDLVSLFVVVRCYFGLQLSPLRLHVCCMMCSRFASACLDSLETRVHGKNYTPMLLRSSFCAAPHVMFRLGRSLVLPTAQLWKVFNMASRSPALEWCYAFGAVILVFNLLHRTTSLLRLREFAH